MKPILEIIRLEENYRYGTFGVLKIAKEVFCVTLEPPDLVNKAFRSCIPAQQYSCMRSVSHDFGETFKVIDVPDRKFIYFHPGNIVEHTEGCIILAQYFGKLRGDRGVLNSGKTFEVFMGMLKKYNSVHLTIREVY